MRYESTECLPTEPFGRDRLLHVIAPAAGLVLRADQHGARGAHRGYPVAGDGAIAAEEEGIVAQDLEVVGRPVARLEPFVVEHGGLAIGAERQMAPKARRRPRRVARVARHLLVRVRECIWRGGAAPGRAVLLDRLREPRLLVVGGAARCDGVDDLADLPLDVLV